MLGRLHYRTSYGQNVLQHSIEVSHIAGLHGRGAGGRCAGRQAGGPAPRSGQGRGPRDGGHPCGRWAWSSARKYREKEDIIHAIQAHHNDVEPKTMVACLVQAADAISAARPGARRENLENYIKRLEKLEEITGTYPGVEKSLRHPGRPRGPRHGEARAGHPRTRWSFWPGSLPRSIEDELEYPGQIKVHVLRETKVVEYAK